MIPPTELSDDADASRIVKVRICDTCGSVFIDNRLVTEEEALSLRAATLIENRTLEQQDCPKLNGTTEDAAVIPFPGSRTSTDEPS